MRANANSSLKYSRPARKPGPSPLSYDSSCCHRFTDEHSMMCRGLWRGTGVQPATPRNLKVLSSLQAPATGASLVRGAIFTPCLCVAGPTVWRLSIGLGFQFVTLESLKDALLHRKSQSSNGRERTGICDCLLLPRQAGQLQPLSMCSFLADTFCTQKVSSSAVISKMQHLAACPLVHVIAGTH